MRSGDGRVTLRMSECHRCHRVAPLKTGKVAHLMSYLIYHNVFNIFFLMRTKKESGRRPLAVTALRSVPAPVALTCCRHGRCSPGPGGPSPPSRRVLPLLSLSLLQSPVSSFLLTLLFWQNINCSSFLRDGRVRRKFLKTLQV